MVEMAELVQELDIVEEAFPSTLTVDAHFSHAQKGLVTLNDDCWRVILEFLCTKDVISLYRVCRQWRGVVRRYFQGAGVRLRVETITNHWVNNDPRHRICRTLIVKDDPICFNAILDKWGMSIAELMYNAKIADDFILWNLGENCPKLEDVTFVRLDWRASSCDWADSFTNLKRICFENCSISDGCVSKFLHNNSIEELVIRMCDFVKGEFLNASDGKENCDLTNLNTLILSRCPDLEYENFISAVKPVNRLAGVTKLELCDMSKEFHAKVHLILLEMPQLELLTLDCRVDLWNSNIFRIIPRLLRLTKLVLNNVTLTDNNLNKALSDKTGSTLQHLTLWRFPPHYFP